MKKPPQKSRVKKPKNRIQKLELLLEYSKKNISEKNLDTLLIRLADEAKALLDADRCSIFIMDKKNKTLWSKVAHGPQGMIAFSWDRGIAGEVGKTGKILNIKDAYKDQRFNPEIDKKTGYKTRSILTVPMKNLRDETVGVFQVLNKKGSRFFKTNDEELLNILASQGAVAVENTQLYALLKNAAHDTIFRLASAAECKDKDTGKHILRMSKFAAILAEAMGFERNFCDSILLASPLHDIGKLGVPDAILMKPASLNGPEWTEMKKHTVYGGDILKNSGNDLIRMSERIAVSHHEKFDGSGYPKGLKGEEIPIEGRIAALADIFDALTSKRIYKEKFSMEETLKIIRDGKGKHFDPKVVEAFEKALPKLLEVMVKHSDQPEATHSGHIKTPSLQTAKT